MLVQRRETRAEPLAQRRQVAPLQREAARVLVPAEVREEIGHGLELLVQVDRRDAPRRAGAVIAVDADHQRGAVIFLGDSSGGQADDALVPAFARENQDARK